MIRGRYAPSPTGELHLGNSSTAMLAWLSVRSRDGSFVMRIEDLDRQRSRAEWTRENLDDLVWLGLDWDEGPDVGGPHAPYDQGSRTSLYRAALEQLREQARVYPCFCSRKDILAAASAPHPASGERRYPGTCRTLPPAEAQRRVDSGARQAWRFAVPDGQFSIFRDRIHGDVRIACDDLGDFVVYRAEDEPAYQLAVVVDDAAMGITEVVRGDDLLGSTAMQQLLYRALVLPQPSFGHVPLLMGPDGARLSKRHRDITLRELREAGYTAEGLVGVTAHLLGLRPDARPVDVRALIDGFDLARIKPAPGGIAVDPSALLAAAR